MEKGGGGGVVDHPTLLICISDIYLSKFAQEKVNSTLLKSGAPGQTQVDFQCKSDPQLRLFFVFSFDLLRNLLGAMPGKS